jgi:hypothetical protein
MHVILSVENNALKCARAHCDYIDNCRHNGLVQGCNICVNDSLNLNISTRLSGEVHHCDMVTYGDDYSCASACVQNPILSNQFFKCKSYECYESCCIDHS